MNEHDINRDALQHQSDVVQREEDANPEAEPRVSAPAVTDIASTPAPITDKPEIDDDAADGQDSQPLPDAAPEVGEGWNAGKGGEATPEAQQSDAITCEEPHEEAGASQPNVATSDASTEQGHDVEAASPQSEEGAEGSLRRVVLQAGTDEASLKALELCKEKVTQLRLRMHPLAARWENDKHVIIFFRADDKVDFRKLVRELSRLLHARIELRQVGPREQGKLCGLVGKCGYPLCCQTFLGQFAQSTIKMAKTQELALNPMKISGVCGRLLCCLNYEQDMYLETKSRLPKVNRMVETEYGPGRVVAVNVLKETVMVQFETATKELRPDQILPAEPQS
ncbi:MAG: hypothetical protein JXA58_02600 [Dehalococcoidia bacterium]|nr:hypothetical protein [Dehalococcoidia bacterium]